jgi:NAD(P)-dependent dehydrogenase (short-subunit alcohol dehydrogenase family)
VLAVHGPCPRRPNYPDRVSTAIVTGTASGIGRASAERLRDSGWRVIGLDLRDDGPNGVERVVGDAGDAEILQEALDRTDDLHGLVCAAGLPPGGAWNDAADWDDIIRTDLSAPYHAMRLSLPLLRRSRGSAVLVGSIVGAAEGSRRSPAYAAAKAGLEGLARSLALIGAPDVRVNVVAPGPIDTGFDPPALPPGERRDVPLGRMGTADEVAATICFLLGPDAAYATGSVFRVDGGRTIASRPDVWG